MKSAYLLFRESKFIGFTYDKKVAKQCLSERNSKFRIEKAHKINSKLFELDRNGFHIYELLPYPHFNRIMTGSENQILRSAVISHVSGLFMMTIDLNRHIPFLHFKDGEEEAVRTFIENSEKIVSDLADEETCVDITEYFEVQGILDYILLGETL